MDQENIKVETAGGLEKDILPPPPPPLDKKRKRKRLVIGVTVLVVLIAVVIYYIYFIAPYESTDDAFVDAYVTVVSSRVPGQVGATAGKRQSMG